MKPMEGIRVVEVAAWTFVPAAGAVLAEWGAEVLKIEPHPGGDPQRGLVSSGLVAGKADVNFFIEQPNHGKKSLSINLRNPQGRELLLKLCETTSWLPKARKGAGIDVEDIRAVNPDIIYVRGHGQGPKGPDADRGSFDLAGFFARSGVAHSLAYGDDPYGPTQPPAFGDLPGGMTIAGAIAAALLERERTGHAAVVDVSLLAFGMWVNAPDIVNSKLLGAPVPKMTRYNLPNPLVNRYLTSDKRLIQLVMLQGTRYWAETLAALGRPDLAADERFLTPEGLFEHREEATALLDEIFATRTFAEWHDVLSGISGVWAPVNQGLDLYDDPQVVANGYLAEAETVGGASFQLVPNPVQFDEQPNRILRAPELGEHTDAVLLGLGLDYDEIIQLKVDDAIL